MLSQPCGILCATALQWLENALSLYSSTTSGSYNFFSPNLLHWFLGLWRRGFNIGVPFMSKLFTVFYSVHVDYMCVSMLITICWKKMLVWWEMRDALTANLQKSVDGGLTGSTGGAWVAEVWFIVWISKCSMGTRRMSHQLQTEVGGLEAKFKISTWVQGFRTPFTLGTVVDEVVGTKVGGDTLWELRPGRGKGFWSTYLVLTFTGSHSHVVFLVP